jgi:mycothiol S-conjugate amidase
MASDRLCLLTVHAHPDDESSKGPGTVARYGAEGIHTVLVCCTGGEEGDILNPAMDTPEVRATIHQVRRQELAAAAAIIGYHEVVMLGYRDSGMPDTPANERPDCFAKAPLDEEVEALVAIIRRVRPQVMVTYPDEQREYPHPDHLRVHEVSMLAFDAAGDPDRFPDAGEPFAPTKLYYTVWAVARMKATHEKFLELNLESPFDERWQARWKNADQKFSTSVDIAGFADVRSDALRAHATQVDPTSPFWFGLPPEVLRTIHPYDDYILAVNRDGPVDVVEDDLFAGLR